MACCDDDALLRPPAAGSELSRRAFLARSLGFALTVYGAGRLGVFDDGIAAAAAAASPSPVLVSVFLEGGADALSLLYPSGDPLYRKLRPHLALSGGRPFTEDDRLTWHPSLDPLAQLHDEGTATAALAGIAWAHSSLSDTFGHVPLVDYLLLLVGLPVVAIIGGWLLAGREPAAIARQPLE